MTIRPTDHIHNPGPALTQAGVEYSRFGLSFKSAEDSKTSRNPWRTIATILGKVQLGDHYVSFQRTVLMPRLELLSLTSCLRSEAPIRSTRNRNGA